MKRIFSMLLVLFFTGSSVFAQNKIFDNFSQKELPGWIWGNIDMTYSHNYDNVENGFADIIADREISPGQFIGKITKVEPMLFTAGNFLNLMLLGVDNDVNFVVSIIYDLDMNNRYDENSDVMLVSNPISLNFHDWKEVKVKLDEENFHLVTKVKEDFSITETEAFALNIDFIADDDFKSGIFQSGIALVSEIQNKETFEDTGLRSNVTSEESVFKAKNYPNPFNPSTTITYFLPEATDVTLTVYDRLGREVSVLVSGNQSEGTHSVEFNAESLPSGIYFYRIKTPLHTEVMKMMLAK
ncbi:MAG: T9SS type A sorting domain-containing protein [Ignavibacteria bacterium]|nr:T9SS type A sorting domain-containing protein [Ignavibacteria bacterium]MCC6885116.1 T9SS type A sorting domain-containing protein [Ignavibacteriales bacterium]